MNFASNKLWWMRRYLIAIFMVVWDLLWKILDVCVVDTLHFLNMVIIAKNLYKAIETCFAYRYKQYDAYMCSFYKKVFPKISNIFLINFLIFIVPIYKVSCQVDRLSSYYYSYMQTQKLSLCR